MHPSELSKEQQMMVETARRLVRSEIIDTHLDRQLDSSGAFPTQIYKRLWEEGFAHLEFPKASGGMGLNCHDHCLIQEEIHYGCLGIGTVLTANSLAAMPVMLAGSADLQKRYLGQLLAEPIFAAYCCSEPDAGSDVAALRCSYRKVGDTYVLRGLKRWITNGDEASWYLVFAREEGSSGHRGIAAFVVDRETPGVHWDGLVHKLGQRTSHTCDVVFEEAVVPKANLVTGPEQGFKLAMATFDRSRPWIGSAAAGVIRRAKEESLRYATERVTFGVPIAQHQLVSSMLANMEIAYQATRLLTLQAARLLDGGQLRGVHSACAKAYGADAAVQVTTDAVQIFGGYGYTQEFIVEKLMRDAKLLQIYEGTSQIQRLVIAKDMVRDSGRSAA